MRNEILNLLKSINISLKNLKINSNEVTVNNIADNFVRLCTILDENNILIHSRDDFADSLVRIIENYYDIGKQIDEILKDLFSQFEKFYYEVIDKVKIKIIVFESNNISNELKKFVHQYILIYYIDDINEVFNYDFDFIVVVSDHEEKIVNHLIDIGINKNRIIKFIQYLNRYIETYKKLYKRNYFRSLLYSHIMDAVDDKDIDILVTGLSYALHGISSEMFSGRCIKLTLPSQDFYYDYFILKNVINNNKKKIKYCILGMAYYSFDFDLSYSSESYRILDTYYPIFKDSHHLQVPENYTPSLGIESIDELTKDKLDFIFNRKLYRHLFENILSENMSPEYSEQYWNKDGFLKDKMFKDFTEDDRIVEASNRAKSHDKDHPKTRIENEIILTNMLKLLVRNEIKPIIVVFPTTKYYYSQFNTVIKSRFYNIIEKLKKDYEFQFVDMFQSDKFDLHDFLDWDHLNKKGAEKMTKILDEKIRNEYR